MGHTNVDFTSTLGADDGVIITLITEMACSFISVLLFKDLSFFLLVSWSFCLLKKFFPLQLSHFLNSDANDSINLKKTHKKTEKTFLPPTRVKSPLPHFGEEKNARRSRLLLFSACLFLAVYAPLVSGTACFWL